MVTHGRNARLFWTAAVGLAVLASGIAFLRTYGLEKVGWSAALILEDFGGRPLCDIRPSRSRCCRSSG